MGLGLSATDRLHCQMDQHNIGFDLLLGFVDINKNILYCQDHSVRKNEIIKGWTQWLI